MRVRRQLDLHNAGIFESPIRPGQHRSTVRDVTGRVIASVNVSGATNRIPDSLDSYSAATKVAVRRLSHAIADSARCRLLRPDVNLWSQEDLQSIWTWADFRIRAG